MAHVTFDAKGNMLFDGKKLSKTAARKQHKERVEATKPHPLCLYVTHDEEGVRHFFRGDEEISESVWIQQHPHLRDRKINGRDGSSDSGRLGAGANAVGSDGPEVQGGQGNSGEAGRKQRAAERQAKAERARRARDELGQPEERPE